MAAGLGEISFRGDFDFAAIGQAVAREVYFNPAGNRAYVTTALPGHLNTFDISDPRAPKHLYAAEAARGAHHLVFSPDGERAYVQNSLINIPGMNDRSISVVDLAVAKRSAASNVRGCRPHDQHDHAATRGRGLSRPLTSPAPGEPCERM